PDSAGPALAGPAWARSPGSLIGSSSHLGLATGGSLPGNAGRRPQLSPGRVAPPPLWRYLLSAMTKPKLAAAALCLSLAACSGTSVVPQITPAGDGTYAITPLYLFMAGLWETTINVDAGAGKDVAVFSFCIEG